MKNAYSLPRIIRRFLPFMRPYIPKYMAAMAFLVLTMLLSLIPPYLIKVIIDNGIKQKDLHAVDQIALWLFCALVVMGVVRGVMDYIHEWVSARLIYDIRAHLFTTIQKQSSEFFLSHKVGDMMSRLRTDVGAVYGVLSNTFLSGLGEVIQILGTAGIMLYLDYKLTIIALLFIPALYLVLRITGKRIRELSLIVRDKDASLLEFFHEVLSNIHVVKLFAREEYMSDAHSRLSDVVIDVSLRRLRYKFVSIFLIGLVVGTAPVLFVWYGGHQVVAGTLSPGSFIAFYLFAARLYSPIQSLSGRGVEISNGLASAQRIIEYFDLHSTIADPALPVDLHEGDLSIAFQDVTFRYPGARQDAVKNLDFQIAQGEKIALVGPSGAGKTTVVSLLCRLYDVGSGEILVDGKSIKELSLKSLRNAIGVVSQEIFLFNDTILENIRFARPEAGEAEVIEAAKAAELHQFIENLPNGYHTVVGSKGMKLSGGQRQRIALARVVLKGARIWILDEFTSSLDSQTEALVYDNIAPLLHGKTAITIAHRLSTVVAADRIVVLQDGRVLEMGTHKALAGANGLYQKLFKAQMQPRELSSDEKHDAVLAASTGNGHL
jgi:ABC-type multidrug transport system fused ATPase/permease subunit